jgi:hypothetical protein
MKKMPKKITLDRERVFDVLRLRLAAGAFFAESGSSPGAV